MRGRLIVFEGADGSGKTTQSKLLVSYLRKNKIPSAYIAFPRYDDSLWAKMVRRYLLGDFGKIDEVDPYFASMLYAGDRLSGSSKLKGWLAEGKLVVGNRYIGSNIGHMAAKLTGQREKTKYIKWLEDLEYGENKIPKEDLVVFLYVPVEVSKRLMKGRQLDIHEKDLDYLGRVLEVYQRVAKSRKNWVTVDCTVGGEILPPEKIHERVLGVLRSRRVL